MVDAVVAGDEVGGLRRKGQKSPGILGRTAFEPGERQVVERGIDEAACRPSGEEKVRWREDCDQRVRSVSSEPDFRVTPVIHALTDRIACARPVDAGAMGKEYWTEVYICVNLDA